jgi:hypothetical protein
VCTISAVDRLECFGSDVPQALNINALQAPPSVRPQFPISGGDHPSAELAVGPNAVCATREDGRLLCFGRHVTGIHYGTGAVTVNHAAGGLPVAYLRDVIQAAMGRDHGCAVRQNGAVACWGRLGLDVETSLPIPIAGIDDGLRVAVGETMPPGPFVANTDDPLVGMNACVVHRDGGVSCWPSSQRGVRSRAPVRVPGLGDVRDVRIGSDATCALHTDGRVSCWGSGSRGQLGNGAKDYSRTPVLVEGITDATGLGGGEQTFCAVGRSGRVSCWGSNEHGLLAGRATGTDGDSARGVEIPGVDGVVSIGASGDAMCGVTRTGELSCWGANERGQCGHGDPAAIAVPGIYGIDADSVRAFGAIVQAGCGDGFCCALHVDGHLSCAGTLLAIRELPPYSATPVLLTEPRFLTQTAAPPQLRP